MDDAIVHVPSLAYLRDFVDSRAAGLRHSGEEHRSSVHVLGIAHLASLPSSHQVQSVQGENPRQLRHRAHVDLDNHSCLPDRILADSASHRLAIYPTDALALVGAIRGVNRDCNDSRLHALASLARSDLSILRQTGRDARHGHH